MSAHLFSAVQLVSDRGWGMHDGDLSGDRHWIGAVIMALVVAGVVALVLWALRRGRGQQVAAPVATTAAAQAILAERLARGDVSPDDYRSLLAVLREQHPTT
ncbi:MAG: hypothetical protein Q7V57_05895 [Actinomycetota bacterium]|nr:hypothetical protein [Actinomycetota bacterium]